MEPSLLLIVALGVVIGLLRRWLTHRNHTKQTVLLSSAICQHSTPCPASSDSNNRLSSTPGINDDGPPASAATGSLPNIFESCAISRDAKVCTVMSTMPARFLL